MTTYFKHIAQITARADYDKILRKALATTGQEPFHYFDAFPFDKKEAPLVLVGDVAKPLIADLKKLVPKAQYGMGACTVTAQDEIIFERETGKLQPKLVSAALKLSGIKSTVKFNGDDDEDKEGDEAENDEGQPQQPQVKANPEAPSVNVKPSGDKPAPLSPKAKEFQDKLKIVRPAFDEALKNARRLNKMTWAQDLDSNFTQMVQEAKAGKFDVALQTLARLARIIKSEEAARAEVKHQTNKEDSDYAEMHQSPASDHLSPQEMKQARKGNKAGGYGLTEDGNVSYALPLKPGEWQSGVVDKIDSLHKALSKEPVDFGTLNQTYSNLIALLNRARQHAAEGDDKQHRDREQALERLADHLADLDGEISNISYMDPSAPMVSVQSILNDRQKLRDLIETLERPDKSKPSQEEFETFKQQSGERARRYNDALDKEAKQCQQLEHQLREQAIRLKEEAPNLPKDEIATRREQLEEMKTILEERRKNLHFAQTLEAQEEKKALDRFSRGVRNPQQLVILFKLIDQLKGMIDHKFFQQAMEAIDDAQYDLADQGFAQEDPVEQKITQDLASLHSDLRQQAQLKAASPLKAARMAKRLHGEAAKVGALMD